MLELTRYGCPDNPNVLEGTEKMMADGYLYHQVYPDELRRIMIQQGRIELQQMPDGR